MTAWIVATSLRFRALVAGLAIAVAVVGFTRLRDAPVDVLPEFTPPYVEIQTEALGLSAAEVEQLITVPLEADLLNGVEGVDIIRSKSVPGLSSIVMVFERGAGLYRSRQLVQERLTQAHALPNVSRPPTMLPPLSSSSRVLVIGLSSDRLTPIERSVIARWTVRPRLMGVPGVANVSIWGQRERQLQVQVDPERLRDRHVTLDQVVRTAGNAQVVSPLSFLEASTPGTGGFIETAQQRLQVRHVLDRIASPETLGRVPVEGTGGRLRLTDVADVVEDHQPLIGDAVVDDADGLMLVVEKLPGANTLEVTEGVEDALETLKPGLSGLRTDPTAFRPASYIEEALDSIGLALAVGALLAVLAFVAFLRAWRTALVGLVSVPLSLAAAALVLELRGETISAIAFTGIAIALAVLVDDAVTGAARIARRVREHRRRGAEGSLSEVVLEATQDVRRPLAYATLVVLAPVVPVAVMEGRPGAFFAPLVLSYVLAVLASTVVALTVTPALSLLLLSRGAVGARPSPVVQRVGAAYRRALSRVVGRPRAALLAAGACVLAALIALLGLGTSLVPSFKDRDVLVRLDSPPGTSQPAMTRVATQASRQLRAIPGVATVGAHVGRAVTGDRIVDVNHSELWVGIDRAAGYDETLAAIDAAMGRLRGVQHDVLTYSEERIREVGALADGRNDAPGRGVDVLTGADAPVIVRVYGEDLAVASRQAAEVRRVLSGVEGIRGPRVRLPATERGVEIEVDLARAQRWGIKPGDVRRAEATLLQGIQVGSLFEEQKVFDVIVQGTPSTRQGVGRIRRLLIDTPGGGHVRLGRVADVRVRPTPAVISRDAVSRYVDVTAGVAGRDAAAVRADVEARLGRLAFPLEYHAEVIERSSGEEIGAARMLGFALAAAVAVFLLLQAAFRSWSLAAMAFLSLPAALMGGMLAALIEGSGLSLASLAGLLAVFAIAARTAVLLVGHLQRARQGDAAIDGERVIRAAGERLGPILLSAVSIVLVFLPFAVLGARPGLEILHPMAIVVIGGLLSATLVSLFVLPALYLQTARAIDARVLAREPRREEREPSDRATSA